MLNLLRNPRQLLRPQHTRAPRTTTDFSALKLLLEHQHDVSVKDDRGQTLLHLAASFGLEEAMATLLQVPGGKELMDSKERLNCR